VNRKKKIQIKESILIIISWIIIINLFSWYALTIFEIFFEYSELQEVIALNEMAKYMTSGYQYVEATLFGLIYGFFFVSINYFVDSSRIRLLSFGKLIFLKSLFYLIAMMITFVFIYHFMTGLGVFPEDVSETKLLSLVTGKFVFSMVALVSFVVFSFNFILEINKKFGPGNLWNMIIGKYQKPRIEERIFMFLDLKDSTRIAEDLGHKVYSRLLKRCFHDLTDIILKYDAEVYQYVGDEVVLTWSRKKGLMNGNCIKAFFSFRNKLIQKSDFYKNTFNEMPEFKAGMDMGQVTATEIGDIKREIAFHGDVLNTASRIQHKCKELNEHILISENLSKSLNLENGFDKTLVGEMSLRGKHELTKIYKVTYSDQ
jgi:adenylate cyclase